MSKILVDLPIYLSLIYLITIFTLLCLGIINKDLTPFILLGNILTLSAPFFTYKIYNWRKKLNDIDYIIISFVKRANKTKQNITINKITERYNIDQQIIDKLINKKIFKKKELNIRLTRRARCFL